MLTGEEHFPAIRILPMSPKDKSFENKTVRQVQENYFLNYLPQNRYLFKKRLHTDTNSLILFQFDKSIIGMALLSEIITFSKPDDNGYTGAYYFYPDSIAIFRKLITFQEMKKVWQLELKKSFNQAMYILNTDKYQHFWELIQKKRPTYPEHFNDDVVDVSDQIFQNKINELDLSAEEVIDQPVDVVQIPVNISKEVFKKSVFISKNAIIHANYLCEVNKMHPYFLSSVSGRNFVEAHHLIPLKFQKYFKRSLDVEANIVSLCVFCHRKIHHSNDILDMLQKLYDHRRIRLSKCEIEIEFNNLKELYFQGGSFQ